jgi:hypothetical protein
MLARVHESLSEALVSVRSDLRHWETTFKRLLHYVSDGSSRSRYSMGRLHRGLAGAAGGLRDSPLEKCI